MTLLENSRATLAARIEAELRASVKPLWPAQLASRIHEPKAAIERALTYAAENGTYPLRLVKGQGYALCLSAQECSTARADLLARVKSLTKWERSLALWEKNWPPSTRPATSHQPRPLPFSE